MKHKPSKKKNSDDEEQSKDKHDEETEEGEIKDQQKQKKGDDDEDKEYSSDSNFDEQLLEKVLWSKNKISELIWLYYVVQRLFEGCQRTNG